MGRAVIAVVAVGFVATGAAAQSVRPSDRQAPPLVLPRPTLPYCQDVSPGYRDPCVVTCSNCASMPPAEMRAMAAEYARLVEEYTRLRQELTRRRNGEAMPDAE